jgi:hypothetical protein
MRFTRNGGYLASAETDAIWVMSANSDRLPAIFLMAYENRTVEKPRAVSSYADREPAAETSGGGIRGVTEGD